MDSKHDYIVDVEHKVWYAITPWYSVVYVYEMYTQNCVGVGKRVCIIGHSLKLTKQQNKMSETNI